MQFHELAAHRLSRAHSIFGMIGIIQWGVPERHDAVADIPVDRPLLLGDDVGHLREEAVHEAGQRWRIHAFRAGRKTPNIAEEDRHHPRLTAEDELFRMSGELLDVVWRHEVRKGVADLTLTRLGPEVAE